MGNFPFRPKRKQIDGRWYQYEKGPRRWNPQCQKCSKFKLKESFRPASEAEPEQRIEVCRHCELVERRKEATAKKGPKQTKVCGNCKATFSSVFEYLVDCPKCFQGKNPVPPLDRAYRILFPQLKEYLTIEGNKILKNPEVYPGPTYWHLNPAQRERALALAKLIISKERADPRWIDKTHPIPSQDLKRLEQHETSLIKQPI